MVHKREGSCFLLPLVELAALVQTWPIPAPPQTASAAAWPNSLILVICLDQGFSVLELLTFGPG